MATPRPSPALAAALKDHGIAVHNGSVMSLRTWRDAKSKRDYVFLGVNCTPSLIVRIDAATGKSRQYDMPAGCSGPWSQAFTDEGHLLVTSVDGRLIRIDHNKGKVWSVGHAKQWLWSITRACDGHFYLGSSPNAAMFRYDPRAEKFEEVVRFDKYDKYLRVVLGGNDGYVYGSIGCERSQVVAYHIATGTYDAILPAEESSTDFLGFGKGPDGQIYARTQRGNVYRIEHGTAFRIHGASVIDKEAALANRWRGFVQPRLADGRVVASLDPDAVRIGEGEDAKSYKYTYKTAGTGIFHLAAGPSETVYASTIMPLYILRYTPRTKKLENLGRGGPDNGEAYSFGACDGKLYYATYSQGLLMEYDPAKPWHSDPPGEMKWKDNPKLLGPLGVGHCRPRAMCVGVDGRVWVGSHAEYGKRHGGLMCYDTRSQKMNNNPVVIPDQSIQSLAADDTGNVVFGGTDICRGTGMAPVTKQAHLFAWDTHRQRLLWKDIGVKGETGYINLLHRDGKLYGSSRMAFTFFRYDVAKRKLDYVIPSKISAVREQSMAFGNDGYIYGITWISVFRWHMETGKIEVLYETSETLAGKYPGGSLFHRGAVIIDRRLYFSCASRVMSVRLPR